MRFRAIEAHQAGKGVAEIATTVGNSTSYLRSIPPNHLAIVTDIFPSASITNIWERSSDKMLLFIPQFLEMLQGYSRC
jgi:hypothetical protein